MNPIVRVRVRASETVIHDQRDRKTIRGRNGRRQSPVLLRPMVHLDPVEDKLRPGPLGTVIEKPYALRRDYRVSCAHHTVLIAMLPDRLAAGAPHFHAAEQMAKGR